MFVNMFCVKMTKDSWTQYLGSMLSEWIYIIFPGLRKRNTKYIKEEGKFQLQAFIDIAIHHKIVSSTYLRSLHFWGTKNTKFFSCPVKIWERWVASGFQILLMRMLNLWNTKGQSNAALNLLYLFVFLFLDYLKFLMTNANTLP